MTGTGTENDPFIIYNVTDLQAIADDLDAYYELANDIEAAGVDFAMIAGYFTGSLDGKGFKVKNLTKTISATGAQNWAMFYSIRGTVSNLTLEDCAISITSTDDSSSAAPLTLQTLGATIENCHTSGSVSAVASRLNPWVAQAGGFGRYCVGSGISKCSANVTVSANGCYAYAGGFARVLENCSVEESYAIGDVSVDGFDDSHAAGFAVLVTDSVV